MINALETALLQYAASCADGFTGQTVSHLLQQPNVGTLSKPHEDPKPSDS